MMIGGLFVLSGLTLYAQQVGTGCPGLRVPWQTTMSLRCKPTVTGSQRRLQDVPRNDDGATYVTFDVPGAGNSTDPIAINNDGVVTGLYVDAEYNFHAFVRDQQGNMLTFDVPGDGGGTVSLAINSEVTVAGNWCPDTTFTHCPGFVRDRQGNIVSFDPPDEYYGTSPEAINSDGTVTGYYLDVNVVAHGFVRGRDGSLTKFDGPDAVFTIPWSIGDDGGIAGSYQDSEGHWHGFLRSRGGNITTFDVPGHVNTGEGAFLGGRPISMNPESEIAGSYLQTTNTYYGFLRHRDGSFDTFYAADYSPCCIWTFPTAINGDRTMAGYINDGFDLNRGFVRTPDGNVTLFDAPGAGTGDFQGTVVFGMTPGGVIAGVIIDDNYIDHGFLRIPQ
jgi:hypothetical protein